MAGLGPMTGIPIGNIGPQSGADYSPYLEMWRLKQAQSQTAQQIALQQQAAEQQRREFEQKFAEEQRQFDTSTKQRGDQFMTEADLQRQGLGLKAELGRGELGLRGEEVRGGLELRGKQYGLEERKLASAEKASAEAGARDQARIDLDKTRYTDERADKKTDEDRRKRLLSAATDVETNLLPYLENERAVRGEGFDVSRAARINIARQYADDPEAKAAALAALTDYNKRYYEKRKNELDIALGMGKSDAQEIANQKAILESETIERTLANLEESMSGDYQLGDLYDTVRDGGVEALSDDQLKRAMSNPYIREQVEFIASLRAPEVDEEEVAMGKALGKQAVERGNRELGLAPKDPYTGKPMDPAEVGAGSGEGLSKPENDLLARLTDEQERAGMGQSVQRKNIRDTAIAAIKQIEKFRGSTDEGSVERAKKAAEMVKLYQEWESGNADAFDKFWSLADELEIDSGMFRSTLFGSQPER